MNQTNTAIQNLLVIDSQVTDWQSLAAGVGADTAVLILDSGADGLIQLSDYLSNASTQGHPPLQSIQIISHGSSGSLQLGSSTITKSNLGLYTKQLAKIGSSLTDTGDILLYGCNVAAGQAGLDFINQFAALSNADVAASNDITGSAAFNGNWQLEVSTGAIEASSGLTTSSYINYGDILLANTAPTFALRDGKVTTAFGTNGIEYGYSLFIQADGKILMSGFAQDSVFDSVFAIARYNNDGTLDTSFNGDGKVKTEIGHLSFGFNSTVTMQADNKILLSGISMIGRNDFAIYRYNADGSLDTSFGGSGLITTDISNDSDDFARNIILQADGRILQIGYSLNANYINPFIAMVRYNRDGTPDISFGNGGKVTTDIISNYSNSVCVQADGKILVHGSINGLYVIMRYNTDGSLDTSFGSGGISNDLGVDGNFIAIQSDGKILLGGGGVLMRFNTDGSLDTSFDSDGKVTTDIFQNRYFYANSISLQADGKILLGGNSDSDFAAVRYNIDGTLDTSFDGDGKVITDINKSYDSAESIALQADGKILLGGTSNGHFAVVRYNIDGSLDASFNNQISTLNGVSTLGFLSQSIVLDNNVQIYDTELTLAGNYNGATLTLARHNGSQASDLFESSGTLSSLFTGAYFSVDGTTIGRVISNASGILTLVFNSLATQPLVNKAMQQIAYSNSESIPPVSVQIDWTFSDGNIGSQGIGGELSTIGSSTVLITFNNQTPTLAQAIPDLSIQLGSILHYSFPTDTFLDANAGTTFAYTISMADGTSLPPWIQFDEVNRTISGTPNAIDVGNFNIKITATDNANASVSDTFQLVVYIDSISPNVITFTPTDGATDVAIGSNISLSFDEAIQKGIGTIAIHTGSATGVVVESFDAATSNRLVFLGSSLTIDPTSVLANNTQYFVTFDAGSVKDLAGNNYAGIATYDFTTINIAPTFTTLKSVVSSGNEDSQISISLANIAAKSNAVDLDGTINGYVVKSVSSGSLLLGTSSGTATAWTAGSNEVIDSAHLAYWTPAANANGVLNAFTAVAKDNGGLVSTTAIQATVDVTPVNDAPTLKVFAAPIAIGNEDSQVAITYAQLQAQGNEADVDGTVTAFVIKAVSTGSLKIGTSALAATAWNAVTNNTIDVTHQLYWTPAANANGALNAFTAVAKDNGGLESVSTIQAQISVANVNDLPTGTVSITGVATQGQQLTASNNLLDADGMGTVTYTWYASGSATAIGTGSTFALTQAQVGKTISAVTSYTDLLGTAESVSSSVTGTVANVNDQPTGSVSISGTPTQGHKLTASNILADSDGMGTVTYTWYASGSALSIGTGSTYILTSAQVGKTITAVASYTDLLGTVESVLSLATVAVASPVIPPQTFVSTVANEIFTAVTSNDTVSYINARSGVKVSLLSSLAQNNVASGVGIDTLGNIANLIGSGFNDKLTGNAKNNVLTGGAGSDVLIGGGGKDIYVVAIKAAGLLEDTVTGNTGTDTIQVVGNSTNTTVAVLKAAPIIENIDISGTGTSKLNLTGNALANILTGNAGNNLLNGGIGADSLIGGAGNDSYTVDNANDVVTEKTAEGIDLINSSVSYQLSANVENLTLTGKAAINASGNADNNLLTGNAGINSLSGNEGIDTLVGLAGNDSLNGGNGNDLLRGGAGNDKLTGGEGVDTFWFDTATNAKTNKDTLTDFVSGTDKLQFSVLVLKALGAVGQFTSTDQRFWSSTTGLAHDVTDRLIYNTTTGELSYDSNGSAKGGAVLIEVMGTATHPVLLAADMWVA